MGRDFVAKRTCKNSNAKGFYKASYNHTLGVSREQSYVQFTISPQGLYQKFQEDLCQRPPTMQGSCFIDSVKISTPPPASQSIYHPSPQALTNREMRTREWRGYVSDKYSNMGDEIRETTRRLSAIKEIKNEQMEWEPYEDHFESIDQRRLALEQADIPNQFQENVKQIQELVTLAQNQSPERNRIAGLLQELTSDIDMPEWQSRTRPFQELSPAQQWESNDGSIPNVH